MELKTPPELVQSAEPTTTDEEEGYRVLTYEDVEVSIDISGRRGPSKPTVWVAGDRLDTQVEVVTDIRFLGFELWRYTYEQNPPEKNYDAGTGSHRGTFSEVEIEENHYGEGEVHEFSIRVKR